MNHFTRKYQLRGRTVRAPVDGDSTIFRPQFFKSPSIHNSEPCARKPLSIARVRSVFCCQWHTIGEQDLFFGVIPRVPQLLRSMRLPFKSRVPASLANAPMLEIIKPEQLSIAVTRCDARADQGTAAHREIRLYARARARPLVKEVLPPRTRGPIFVEGIRKVGVGMLVVLRHAFFWWVAAQLVQCMWHAANFLVGRRWTPSEHFRAGTRSVLPETLTTTRSAHAHTTNAREVHKVILRGGWTSLACLPRPPWYLPLTKTEDKDELVAHLMAKKATKTLRRRAVSVGLFCQVAQCAHREFGSVAT